MEWNFLLLILLNVNHFTGIKETHGQLKRMGRKRRTNRKITKKKKNYNWSSFFFFLWVIKNLSKKKKKIGIFKLT